MTLPLIAPAHHVEPSLIAFTISFDEFAIANFLVPPGDDTFSTSSTTTLARPTTASDGCHPGLIIAVSLFVVVMGEVGRRAAERKLEGQT